MASLLDIAPIHEDVRGFKIYGISALGIAQLLYRFPTIRGLFAGREVTSEELIQLGPDVIAAVIAAGIGKAGDNEEEMAAATLDIGTQLDFLEAIIRVTLPNGLHALMGKVERLTGTLGVDAEVSTEDQDTKSPKRSKNSSPTGIPMPGTTRPAN